MSVSHHPPVLWAQRKDKLFVTIDVQDCVNPKLKLEKDDGGSGVTTLKFTGTVAGGSLVDLDLALHGEVDTKEAKVSVTGRHVVLVIPKKQEGFWPRLTKEKQPRFVSVDWSKWVDEDEEDDAPEFDMSSMGQFGGLDQFDSDDDDDDEGEEEGEGSGEPSGPTTSKPETAETEEAAPNGATNEPSA